MTKKERTKNKRRKILIRKISKKYPWLRYRGWNDKIVPRTLIIEPNENGWTKAFFYMMCDEINADLKANNYINDFRILEYKEKWGLQTIYTGSIPEKSNVWDIIHKYETISRNVCVNCGKPDVPITNNGWILPLCRECCENKEYWDSIPSATISDEFKEEADIIRRKWNKKKGLHK